jgi:hypothetical protein
VLVSNLVSLVSQMYIVHREENQECSLGYNGVDLEAAGVFFIDFCFELSFIYVRFQQVEIT